MIGPVVRGKNALAGQPSRAGASYFRRLGSRLDQLGLLIGRLSRRTRFLIGVWVMFAALVAAGVHGSSIALAIEQWSPGSSYAGYLIPRLGNQVAGLDANMLKEFGLSKSRFIRTDEYLRNTPLALSQLSHVPRFPVINSTVGDGENMLLYHLAPVWHITALARPATWGFFFLGPQRGLAWEWWLPTFGCFTTLTLLLEIILRGHRRLAAFGAFWFCGSAYNVSWSFWPAALVFFLS